PLFVTNAIDNLPLPVYGDGRAVRDYLFVRDHAAGIDAVLRHGVAGNVYNIGGDNEVDTLRLADAILKLLGKPESLIRLVEDRPGHDRRYAVNSAKLRALGWEPTSNFEQTIERTVRWYVDHEDWWRPIKNGDFQDFYLRL